jgi:hypothetical protein
MSQINNIITTQFRASGGNVVAQMASYASSGLTRMGQVINQNTRMSERLGDQWRAIATTIRYAVAGQAVFGITRLVGQIKDLNTQLGEMQAISGIGPGTRFTGGQINTLFSDLGNTAADSITPLQDVNDAAINFLSTVQNVKAEDLPSMLTDLGRAAKIAQTPMEDLTQAATTMQIAFGRPVTRGTIGQFSRMWETLIGVAPGVRRASPTIAQALPGVASMFELAPGAPVRRNPALGQAQMMSLVLGVLRTGMPAATAMRGLTYLLQSIAQPTGAARGALAGIGITPQFVEQRGINAALMRLLRTITRISPAARAQIQNMPEEQLADIEAGGGTLPGIPAAEMLRLRTMIPRIHGIRAAIILANQLTQRGDVESLTQDMQRMLEAQDENSRQTHELNKAWENLRKRSRLADAANQVNVMTLQIAQAFEPVFGFVAEHAIMPTSKFLRRHQDLTRYGAWGAGGILALLGVSRGLGNPLSKIPGPIGKILGGISPGQGWVKQQAIAAAMGAGGQRNGQSPQDALFVIVVGQVFGGGGGPGPTPPPSGGFHLPGFGWAGRVPWQRALGVGTIAAGVAGAWETRNWMAHHVQAPLARFLHMPSGEQMRFSPTGRPYIQGMFRNFALSRDQERMAELRRAQQLGHPNAVGISQYGVGTWKGRADVHMVLDLRDPQTGKITRRRVHVPVDMWQGGRHPSSKAQAGKGTRR